MEMEDKLKEIPDDAGKEKPVFEKGSKERLYDRVPFTVRQMDIIIAALCVLFIVVLVIGILKGRGFL